MTSWGSKECGNRWRETQWSVKIIPDGIALIANGPMRCA